MKLILGLFLMGILSPAKARVVGIDELVRLDLMPLIQDDRKIGMVSSYDQTGGNDDGFSGKYSFLRKEKKGLVIADLKGPGAIYRIWTATPTDDVMEFYFDGEVKPRISVKISDLFSGDVYPFLNPLVGSGAGGYFSYIPLVFKKSCKVLVKAKKFQFYQINYAQYPDNSGVFTFKKKDKKFKRSLKKAAHLFKQRGKEIWSYFLDSTSRIERTKFSVNLKSGRKANVFQKKQGGRILGFKIGPASRFRGKARDVILRMFWDDSTVPAVEAPMSDFFGYSFGEPATRSLFLGTRNNKNYVYFPMPFDKRARIEVEFLGGSSKNIKLAGQVISTKQARQPGEGKFYAIWNRERPTRIGTPYTVLDLKGKGHVVGTIGQFQGYQTGQTVYFEGDDQVHINGELRIQGTGTEDIFNGGWYDVPGRWTQNFSMPLSGNLGYQKYLGRTGGYRFMIGDRYTFSKSIRYTLEHGPKNNQVKTDYLTLSYLYLLEPPVDRRSLPGLRSLRVVDPKEIIFDPGWNTPVLSNSLRNASLSKKSERIGGKDIRYLSYKAWGNDLFGDHHISFDFNLPLKGLYQVFIKGVTGPRAGGVQIFSGNKPLGKIANFRNKRKKLSKEIYLGDFNLQEGNNRVFFHIVSQGAPSTAVRLNIPDQSKEKNWFEIGINQISFKRKK